MRFIISAPVCVTGDHMIGNSPNKIAQAVMIFGQPQTKLSALWDNLGHDEEMYGYMAVYLRLKGLVPPTSDRRPK